MTACKVPGTVPDTDSVNLLLLLDSGADLPVSLSTSSHTSPASSASYQRGDQIQNPSMILHRVNTFTHTCTHTCTATHGQVTLRHSAFPQDKVPVWCTSTFPTFLSCSYNCPLFPQCRRTFPTLNVLREPFPLPGVPLPSDLSKDFQLVHENAGRCLSSVEPPGTS